MQQADNSDFQIKRFLNYLKAYKVPFVFAIIGMIGYSAVDTFVFAQLQPMIDESLGKNDHDYLRLAAYAIVPLFLLRGTFNFMGSYTLSWIGAQVVMRMRQQLFDKYIHLPVSFHDNHSVGGLISKVTYDTEQVANASGKALLTLVREGALVIGLLCVMFYYSWQLSLIFLLIGPVVAVIVSFVSKRFRVVSKNIQHSMGNLTSSVEQAVKGHKVVIMFGGQEIEQNRFKQKNNHNRQQTMKLSVTSILSVSSIQVIASIALAVVLYIASTPGMLEKLTAGVFINVVFCMVMLLKPLKQLTTINNQFQKGMAACASIFEILDEADEEDSGRTKIERATGKIEFDDVTFSYPGKHTPALSNVSFTANPGQSVALVGRSGSGKSTISSLLTRFYVPQEGQIRLDDMPLNDVDLKALRAQFAVVSQNVTLFNDTIANNIAYGARQNVSRKEIENAARMAHVEEFLANLPDGLDTVIGENGLMLSGGQRQRIAIARAILAEAPILILDEATSALDTESERLIQDALEKLQKRCTSIVVAHRLSTIENADCIMVVEQGRIIEKGKHDELLEKGGHYAQLHALQFGETK
ncbi:lipid A export permease/ATP-binding protein MsbA [Alteromonas mediterranea]|jgi:ATP-binding cassette, subfamily B, bacterial MsbA|uniref:Lipid A ABC transporter ATPase/inner membrane protein MsbA n=3 Tax=Alteromonas mediterranea TaxID=314275 RepID=S5AF39_9ALTE|nr:MULTISPECIES: lipid A export permease/ATP-binding protein MsbA [Alteromonas]AGP78019.1 lipid A ABC transporter ATPase/inner membrane protein MsbA [Alteromonas mediterranea 615]AGP93612.1 lipid A ABC transporter ATPase/inner membrane protein MsbA [Alteromonas mediterranea U8]MEA3379285.1 lipid A export permease/ATP-binding protein MsbA [Pseudomonadota bacterium]AFV85549.1 lipid A ABC exporter, fused ATPase and inner membrane subunits MsbA [Alteromonas mediterranea DE1]AGP85606.1 lipid A ABC |tara:strand:- start:2583 stop:4331 length:1749 start_codon:yes stop_codon:yes gene_type:complete